MSSQLASFAHKPLIFQKCGLKSVRVLRIQMQAVQITTDVKNVKCMSYDTARRALSENAKKYMGRHRKNDSCTRMTAYFHAIPYSRNDKLRLR